MDPRQLREMVLAQLLRRQAQNQISPGPLFPGGQGRVLPTMQSPGVWSDTPGGIGPAGPPPGVDPLYWYINGLRVQPGTQDQPRMPAPSTMSGVRG